MNIFVLRGSIARGIEQSEPRHIDVIDVVRGFAALSVAYLHCREIIWVGMRAYWREHRFEFSIESLAAYATIPVMWGSIGVPMLFVISGYVIHRRAARMLAAGELTFSASNFLSRRFVRIYPTLIFTILLTYLCDTVTLHYIDSGKLGDLSLSSALLNLAALQGIMTRPFGSNLPLWSLSIEIQFYLVYPIFIFVRRRLSSDMTLLFACFISILGYIFLHRNNISAFPQYYVTWCVGAYIAECEMNNIKIKSLWKNVGLVIIVFGSCVFLLQYLFLSFVSWAIGFALLLWFLLQEYDKFSIADSFLFVALAEIGRFSYSLYLSHLPLALLISAVAFGGVHQDNIFYSVGVLVALVVAARLVFSIVEEPSLQLLRRMAR